MSFASYPFRHFVLVVRAVSVVADIVNVVVVVHVNVVVVVVVAEVRCGGYRSGRLVNSLLKFLTVERPTHFGFV